MPEPHNIHNTPPTYRELVQQWGPPLGIEETRKRWSELVTAATSGTVTLISRFADGRPQWTALVPLAEVADTPADCPVWPLLDARKKLGALVDDAARWPTGRTQLLSSHRRPVAALIPAALLADRHGEHLDVEELLQSGGTVTLTFHPGESGSVNEEGDLATLPEDAGYVAIAATPDGTEIGSGDGATLAEAMIRLTRHPSGASEGTHAGDRDPWALDPDGEAPPGKA